MWLSSTGVVEAFLCTRGAPDEIIFRVTVSRELVNGFASPPRDPALAPDGLFLLSFLSCSGYPPVLSRRA